MNQSSINAYIYIFTHTTPNCGTEDPNTRTPTEVSIDDEGMGMPEADDTRHLWQQRTGNVSIVDEGTGRQTPPQWKRAAMMRPSSERAGGTLGRGNAGQANESVRLSPGAEERRQRSRRHTRQKSYYSAKTQTTDVTTQ